MSWSREDERRNTLDIMAGNIDRDSVGSRLTPEARHRAIEFAADAWQGRMGNGEAAQIGIKHVTKDILKE